MKFNYLNRILHRDIGYFFFGMTIIYALSGIALNHRNDWNPSYIIEAKKIWFNGISGKTDFSQKEVITLLEQIDEDDNYKKHYYPDSQTMKVFLDGGSLEVNLQNGEGYLEKISRRPLFYQVNLLHYNPGKWWTYFSDIFAVALLILAITGLFIVKGKNGLKWRGAILAIVGIIIPILFLFVL